MIRDIKPNLKIDQVFALEKLMNEVEKKKPKTIDECVAYSVSLEIAEKINKLYVKTTKSTDLFSKDKTVKMSLKFFEAYSLLVLILTYLKTIDKESKPHNDLLTLALFIQDEFAKIIP